MKKVFKRILAVVMAAVLLVSMTTVLSFAASKTGTCGKDLKWEYDGGILVISGTGSMQDYTQSSQSPWNVYKNEIIAVYFDDTVTGIGDYAFYGCSRMEYVYIGESTTNIGTYAFADCDMLQTVYLPPALKTVEKYAFNGCDGLLNATFYSAPYIDDYAFANCDELYSALFVADAPSSIGKNIFTSNDFRIIFMEGAKGWTTPTWNGYNSFCAYTGTCGEDLYWESIEGDLYIYGTGDMTDYTRDGKKPWSAISDSITSIYIDEEVTSIGDYAFYGCSNVIDITLGSDVVSIGKYAFSGIGIENVAFFTTANIGDHAFANCKQLQVAAFTCDAPETIGAGAFEGCDEEFVIAYVNDVKGWTTPTWKGYNSIQVYIGECGENMIWELIDGVLLIEGEGDMYDYSSSNPAPWAAHNNKIVGIYIYDGVVSIGDYAFTGCAAEAAYFENAPHIGDYAFLNCKSLTEATFERNAPATIGKDVFKGCHEDFTIYYDSEAEGWTTPTWNGYKAKPIGETDVVLGDANGDGKVGNTDLVMIARSIVGLGTVNTAVCDMNGDGAVNNTDLVTVARIIVGL